MRDPHVRFCESWGRATAPGYSTGRRLGGSRHAELVTAILSRPTLIMVFTKRLREGIRRGRIRCSVRIWTRPHVKAGGRYRVDEGQIVVDSIMPMRLADITSDLARGSGFSSVKDLLETARHGPGDKVYLIRLHYLPPGAWER